MFLGIAWNLTQAGLLSKVPYGSWRHYKGYASAVSARIVPVSKVLLEAIPDPHFALESGRKSLRLYEFVPEGIPVDRSRAEKTPATVNSVIDSGGCNPEYLRDLH